METDGKTCTQSTHEVTDKNYWISEVIVSSDPLKRGNKKDFTVVVVDSTREDESNDGWRIQKRKSHGHKNPSLKRFKKKRKQMNQESSDKTQE